jgi:hypothetical protein
MAVTASKMLPLGTSAPDFDLPDTIGSLVSLGDFGKAPALLVIFMCNHCPYVKHVLNPLVELIGAYQAKAVALVGINSNDVANFPDDSPEMAYGAACTPDFFLFDSERTLVYRGQMDASRPGNGIPVTGADLTAAIDAVLEGRPVSEPQRPSIGCNIKWKLGNEPG